MIKKFKNTKIKKIRYVKKKDIIYVLILKYKNLIFLIYLLILYIFFIYSINWTSYDLEDFNYFLICGVVSSTSVNLLMSPGYRKSG